MSRFSSAIFLALVLVAAPAGAADRYDMLPKGPRVGVAIPHTLAANDQNGQHRDFKSLARRRGLILLFSRSLDW